jgi:hypothetical protein
MSRRSEDFQGKIKLLGLTATLGVTLSWLLTPMFLERGQAAVARR